jgi:hypothetical protein
MTGGALVLVALVCLNGDCRRVERPVPTTCQDARAALLASLRPGERAMLPVCVPATQEARHVPLAR